MDPAFPQAPVEGGGHHALERHMKSTSEDSNQMHARDKQQQPPRPSLRAQRLKKFKILKFSSEIENFKRATHQTLFLWGILEVKIEIFKRD